MLEGKQNGRDHYIIIGEGNNSRWLMETLASEELSHEGVGLWEYFNCTRIDIQVSAMDKGVPFRKLTDALKNPLQGWRRSGPSPSITLIEGNKSKKGRGNTLYVGSRKTKNGYMTRIYQKADDREVPYLRFEVELKGKVAGKMFQDMARKGQSVVAAGLRKVLDSYPAEVVELFLGGVDKAIGSTEGYKMHEKREAPTSIRRALWFKYDVAPALAKIRDVDTLEWLSIELVKLLFVLKNRKRQMQDYENADTLGMVMGEAAMAQIEATAAVLVKEGKARAEFTGQLPVQDNLFSIEMLDEMLERQFGSHYNEYR